MDCASFHWEFHAWCLASCCKWPQHFKKQIKAVEGGNLAFQEGDANQIQHKTSAWREARCHTT